MTLSSQQLFLNAFDCKPNPRPPVWVMRQAGRYLPEYRELKKKYDFLTLAKTPDLAAEVTLQPLRRYPLDAAIIFSDILIIPEAMGQPYYFRDQGGIGMEYTLSSTKQIKALETNSIRERLNYLPEAMKLVAAEVKPEKALLGFGGSPWTLATYMLEGGSSKDFQKTKELYFNDPKAFAMLMEKLVEAISTLFKMQIEAGADAIQIFDSWAAVAPGANYEDCSLKWIKAIIERLPKDFPVIIYAKGMLHHLKALEATGATVISLDQSADLATVARQKSPSTCLQGNLDPLLMTLDPEVTVPVIDAMLEQSRSFDGYIFNLGHGITPNAKLETMEALVNRVTQWEK